MQFSLALVALAVPRVFACEPYLRLAPDGNPVGIDRIESLRGTPVRVQDVSGYVRERRLPSDPRLNVFGLNQLFADGRVFMGFGRPNVFLAYPPAVTDQGRWEKFAAKSFHRAKSKLEDTRGIVQSGILLVFKDLTPERAERLYAAAKAHEGSTRWTCVNANGCVLSDAGVTVGGVDPASYYLPGRLLRDALAHGLAMDGEKLEFDVIRVNPDFLETVGLGIDRAVGTTFCRHGERMCEASAAAARHTWLTSVQRAGARVMGLFVGRPTGPRDRRVLEDAIVRMAPDADTPFSARVSEPNALGRLLRLVWGPHLLFEVPLPPALVDRHLPEVLKPFPNPKPDFVTRLKKNLIFSRPVVRFLRAHLAARCHEFDGFSASHLYGMIRTDSAGRPNRYNLVIRGDRAAVMKTSIGMKIVDWLLSKHLMISGYAGDERFAGEFYKREDGAIVLTPNSGTFRPTRAQLIKAAELLALIFPGVRIVIEEFNEGGAS